jgi:hypothetical protein
LVKNLVVLSSVIANKPYNGGNARMVLNWLRGLEQLGVDVFFVEQIRSEHCVDAQGRAVPASHSVNRTYFEEVLKTHGFSRRAALICDARDTLDDTVVHGCTASELYDLADAADLLINISGHLSVGGLKARFRRKAYVDLDPGYTQFWHAATSSAARLEGHDVYFTVGQRIGTAGCRIPTDGIAWQPIRQPIVLKECRTDAPVTSSPRFTTIASWRGAYAPITHDGATYAAKAHEFRKFVELPRLAGERFEIALDIHPRETRDLEALETSGWSLVSPRAVAATPEDYCRYIEGSAAECSAAQGMYVQTKSGWFSDRSARYLGSGKPVLVQDTGFCVPRNPGEGLLVFETVAEAARGAERIARDYDGHSAAARWLAERYFDSNTQLSLLLERTGVA